MDAFETHVQMFLGAQLQLVLMLTQSIVDDIVGSLAVQYDFVVSPQHHRHSFTNIIEIQNAQQFIFL